MRPNSTGKTILFADIEGSTRKKQESQEQAWVAEFADVLSTIRGVVEASGGVVAKLLGDGLMAAFDSAHTAVSAGRKAQQRLRLIGDDDPDLAGYSVKMGLATGGVYALPAIPDDYLGLAVDTAARLCALAPGGRVLADGATKDHSCVSAEHWLAHGPVPLKGVKRLTDVWELRLGEADLRSLATQVLTVHSFRGEDQSGQRKSLGRTVLPTRDLTNFAFRVELTDRAEEPGKPPTGTWRAGVDFETDEVIDGRYRVVLTVHTGQDGTDLDSCWWLITRGPDGKKVIRDQWVAHHGLEATISLDGGWVSLGGQDPRNLVLDPADIQKIARIVLAVWTDPPEHPGDSVAQPVVTFRLYPGSW